MSSLIVSGSPNDLAFRPIMGRSSSYGSRVWGWVRGARDVDPVRGEGSFAILSKEVKAYIFQFLDLGDLAAVSLVSKEWNYIVGTNNDIWACVAFRIFKCPRQMNVSDYRLHTLRFIRELQGKVGATAKSEFFDLTEVVKVKAPSISDLKLMRKLVLPRDVLIVWKVLAKKANIEVPELENLETPKEICDKAKEFDSWINDNRAVLDGITDLDLGRYDLNSLPQSVCRLTNLVELNLSRNNLTELPAAIGSLTNLEELLVIDNKLSGLPVELRNLSRLRDLRIMANRITSIPNEIRTLPNLQMFLIGNNPLPLHVRVAAAIKYFSKYVIPLAGALPVLYGIDFTIRNGGIELGQLSALFEFSFYVYSWSILTLSLDYPLFYSPFISLGIIALGIKIFRG